MPKKSINDEKEEDELIEAASVYNYDYQLEEQENDDSTTKENPKKEEDTPDTGETRKNNPMKQHKKPKGATKKVVLALVGIAALVIFLLIIFQIVNQFFPKDPIVAVVNGDQITQSELITKYAMIPSFFRQSISKEILLNQSIIETILYRESIDAGYDSTNQELDEYYALVIDQSGLSQEEFESQISGINLSIEDVLKVYKQRIIIGKYLNETLLATLHPDDREIENFYNSNLDQFTNPEQVRASHILVETEDSALDLAIQIKQGENFAELAEENSIDQGSASKGGDLGFFAREAMVKEFADAAFSVEVGTITAAKTQFGFHIIKVTDKKPAGVEPLDQVSAQIKDQIFSQKRQDALNLYIGQLMKKADILIISDEFKHSETQAVEPEPIPLPPEVIEVETPEPSSEVVEEPEPLPEPATPAVEPEPLPEVEEPPQVEVSIQPEDTCAQFNKAIYYYASWCSTCNDLKPAAESANLIIIEESNNEALESCFDLEAGFPQLICPTSKEVLKGTITSEGIAEFSESC